VLNTTSPIVFPSSPTETPWKIVPSCNARTAGVLNSNPQLTIDCFDNYPGDPSFRSSSSEVHDVRGAAARYTKAEDLEPSARARAGRARRRYFTEGWAELPPSGKNN